MPHLEYGKPSTHFQSAVQFFTHTITATYKMLSGIRSGLNRSVNRSKFFSAAPKLAAITFPTLHPTVSSLTAARSLSSSMPVHFTLTNRLHASEPKSSTLKGVSTFLK
jgi:hypothetical protein